MFFCKPCADYNNWREGISKSYGTCEMCDKPNQVCSDVPSKYLPPSRAYLEREAKKLAEIKMYEPAAIDTTDDVDVE